MKKLLAPLLFLVAFTTIQAQTGTIRGNIMGEIVNIEGTGLSGVNILLLDTPYGTVSNTEGSFLLKNIPEGKYTLHVSYIGFETLKKEVWVVSGETTNLGSIQLSYNKKNLDAVYINGKKTNKYTDLKSVYVSKMPLKRIDNPQVYSSISAELLKEQVVVNFDDALKNVPGITKLWESTGRGTDGAGYYSLRGFPVQPTLVNGLPAITNGSPDPANIARIEVIKGPSGTLYGGSLISYGGLINIISKKPYETFGGNISYTMGSYGLNRVTLDINTPINDDVALRVNTAYHKQNSFQDAGFQKSFFVAPSLSYNVNDRLSFLINTEFYSGESTNPTMLFLDRSTDLIVHNMDELDYNNERSYTSNDITIKNPTYSLQGQMFYEISDNWKSQTAVSRGSATAKGLYSYLYGASQYYNGNSGTAPKYGVELNSGVVLTRYTGRQNSTTLTTDIQQNFIGDFEIAGMQNKMLVGLDYFSRKTLNANSAYVANGNIYIGNASLANVNASVFNIDEESNYITDGDSGNLTKPTVFALLESAAVNPSKIEEKIYSAYISDVINFTPKLSAMLSLRVDQFESEENSQMALSPKLGLVYQPIDDKVAIFANYMDGFSNVAPRLEGNPRDSIGTPKLVTFEPEHAKQFEIGTKLNLFNDRLIASLSYYDIQVSNIVMERSDKAYFYVQDGKRYSRGVEASVIANPVVGFNIIAGYSYNESKVTEASENNAFLGRRPESAGPQHLANIWASYTFTEGDLNGFGVGFGGNYASENKIFNRSSGVFTLDPYTVLNASVFYSIDEFSIRLKINNVADTEYYSGWSTINPQVGRNMLANFTYNF